MVAPGAVLDCGTADVVIAGGAGKLRVTSGTMTVRAHNFTIQSGRTLLATGTSMVKAGIVLDLSGTFSSYGTVTSRNSGGGSEVRISADLDVVLQPGGDVGIDMTGEGQSVNGGGLDLEAGRDIYIGSKILINGDDGTGSANRNSGGDVDLSAGNGVYVNQLIRGHGRWFNGGGVTIRAGGDVEINHDGVAGRSGEINVEGRGMEGDGGTVVIEAGGRALLSGPISLGSGIGNSGGEAEGGELSVTAGCGGARIEDAVDVRGGAIGGGSLSITSKGNISIAGSVDASSRRDGGDGGDITCRALSGNVVLEGTSRLLANAHVASGSGGTGGTLALLGCQVDVASGAILEATGQSKGRIEATSYRQGTALQNSFGIRISEFADVSAYSTSGQIVLRAATVTSGYCSNSTTTSCTLDSDCSGISCTSGDCIAGNPQTDGQALQFSSVPVVEQDPTLGPCTSLCQ